MSLPLSPDDLVKLKMFIELCSTNVHILNLPQLAFVKSFVEKLGGKVPAGEFKIPDSCPFGGETGKTEKPKKDEPKETFMEEDDSEPESELELNMEGVIAPDNDPIQSMGDETKTPTEEEIEQSSELRGQAAAAFSEKEYQEAIDLYTKAIELNPGNALFHAKRGQAFLKLNKPNACIRDCDRALELNCDSAAAYKFRGRAHRLLGNWEDAARDLRQACKLDYDEDVDEWLREVTPNAKIIEQHRIKQERKRAEKELKKRKEKPRQQPIDLLKFASMVLEPEVKAAMADILKNPENISKYKNNPKIMELKETLGDLPTSLQDLITGGGFPDFTGAGAGGFPGAAAAGFPGAGAGVFPGAGEGGIPGAGAGVGATRSPGADANQTTGTQPSAPKTTAKKPDFVDDGLD